MAAALCEPNQAVLAVRGGGVRLCAPLAPLCSFGVLLSWADPQVLSHQLQVKASETPQFEALPDPPILQAQADGPRGHYSWVPGGARSRWEERQGGCPRQGPRAVLPRGSPSSGVLFSYKTGQ